MARKPPEVFVVKTVPHSLRDAAKLYEERNKLYGDNYKRFGIVMAGLFPEGVHIITPDDHNRFGVFVQMVAKITRYGNLWKVGHKDSLNDLTVYSQMLLELDQEIALRNKRRAKK